MTTDDFKEESRNVHLNCFDLLLVLNAPQLPMWAEVAVGSKTENPSWAPSLRLQSGTVPGAQDPSADNERGGPLQNLEPRGCAGAAAAAG